jgi:hypothetical protein
MTTSTKSTRHPSKCSDLHQTLLALRDLVEASPPSTDPILVSAFQQARVILRRHKLTLVGEAPSPKADQMDIVDAIHAEIVLRLQD